MPVITLEKWTAESNTKRLVTLSEAAEEVSSKYGLNVTSTNIGYLVQYGKISKYKSNGRTYVNIEEVMQYYDKNLFKKRAEWEQKIGVKLDWELSFEWVPERERTKHVHRIHPYKGKFIPQLVEYFLQRYFSRGDIVMDPFMGSGTTLVQAMEMGIHSIGIDISPFNCLIAETKLQEYDIEKTRKMLLSILNDTLKFIKEQDNNEEEAKIDALIQKYNSKYFNHDYRKEIVNGELDEREYSSKVMEMFYREYDAVLGNKGHELKNNTDTGFLDKWYYPKVRNELLFYRNKIDEINDEKIRKLAMIVLSRTARSCRATTHSDLATLKKPVFKPYYCFKHKKICKPVTSIERHIKRYTFDVLTRIEEFSKIKKKGTYYAVLWGDSRYIHLDSELKKHPIYSVYAENRINGIFTSPPYLGQIDYHEQHAYAYELLSLERYDDSEIGPKFLGKSKESQKKYIEGISEVLINMRKYMRDDAKIFIVVNDKKDLYGEIFKMAELNVIREYKRPVLNRTSRDRNPYYESIFMLSFR